MKTITTTGSSNNSNSNSVDFDVTWRPFQLNPTAPKGKGVNKMEMYRSKFGRERMEQMLPYMKETGRQEGIAFSYGGHTGNTLDSHRLIWKAKIMGGSKLQDRVVESLFEAYFEEEQSMGEVSVLVDCAVRAGMTTTDNNMATMTTEGDVMEFLMDANQEGRNETVSEMNQYKHLYGVSGVPFFIFNDGEYTLSGGQPPEEFLAVFRKLMS